MDKKEAATK